MCASQASRCGARALIFGDQLRPRSDLRGVSVLFTAATSAGLFFRTRVGRSATFRGMARLGMAEVGLLLINRGCHPLYLSIANRREAGEVTDASQPDTPQGHGARV
jgi:hypothetical protein